MNDNVKTIGNVHVEVYYLDGRREDIRFKNTVLRNGKIALAKQLAHEENDPYDFYIDKMLFGTNGTNGENTPKYVEDVRTGLFGSTLLSKNVISSIDSEAPNSVILTAVVTFEEGNGETLNEMALRMANGDIYSMATFPIISKTSGMQLVFNWTISFI